MTTTRSTMPTSSQPFSLAPQGTHQGVICEVLDLGWSEKRYKNDTGGEDVKNVHEIQYVFQLNKVDPDTGKRYEVRSKRMNSGSLHEKSALRGFLQALRGHDLLPEENVDPGFVWDSIIGRNALVSVIHTQVGEKTYANIGSYTPLVEGMPQIQPDNYEPKQPYIDKQRAEQQPPVAAGAAVQGQAVAGDSFASVPADAIPF